jgi:hypothetical protein
LFFLILTDFQRAQKYKNLHGLKGLFFAFQKGAQFLVEMGEIIDGITRAK